MWRIQIKFDQAEHDAINKLAHIERRDKRRQIEAIVRRVLIERGLLPLISESTQLPIKEGEHHDH